MKKLFTIILLVVLSVSFAHYTAAASSLVICGQSAATPEQQQNNLCTLSDLVNEVFLVVDFLIGSASLLAIGFILYGGVRMILARGDTKKISDAKAAMTQAIIGLIIVLLAFVIVDFAVVTLTGGKANLVNLNKSLSNGLDSLNPPPKK